VSVKDVSLSVGYSIRHFHQDDSVCILYGTDVRQDAVCRIECIRSFIAVSFFHFWCFYYCRFSWNWIEFADLKCSLNLYSFLCELLFIIVLLGLSIRFVLNLGLYLDDSFLFYTTSLYLLIREWRLVPSAS